MTPANISSFPRPPASVLSACIADLNAAAASLPAGALSIETSASLLRRRSHDYTYHTPHPPDAVAAAASEQAIAAVLACCNAHRVPVIPLAGGTSLEAHTVPTAAGGVVLDTSGMDAVVAVHSADMDAVVEPGVGWTELRDALAPHGLFFPPDPGAAACIGGMCGTNCSGTLAYRYGTMKDNVLSLRVVLADGRVIQTRRRAVKSSAGYDLTRLFVGSEGTLGVVSRATLRLRKLPTHTTVCLASFPSLRAAAAAVHALVLSGTPFQRLEMLDALCVRSVNLHDLKPGEPAPFDEATTLLAECAALSDAGVREQVDAFRRIVSGGTGTASAASASASAGSVSSMRIATSHDEAERLWDLRKKAYFSAPSLRTHPSVQDGPAAAGTTASVGVLTTDVAVPISRLGDAMAAAADLLREEGMVGPMVAHAGDGNFHCFLLVKAGDAAEAAAAERVRDRLGALALSMDGTVTGEHGIGLGKRRLLEDEAGPEAMALMRRLKVALDPNNILNPGKVFIPHDDGDGHGSGSGKLSRL
ncbi:hypothetical protein DFJ73DRAFT_871406 [Zopfochytrium polystomum]|nr:hypothetical protein DFJ73DRAFT_871406 [Zopfochytrium polystomum]